jgi:hypothetical protein
MIRLLSRQKLSLFLSHPVCRRGELLTREGVHGGGASQTIEKNLALYKSFNTLCKELLAGSTGQCTFISDVFAPSLRSHHGNLPSLLLHCIAGAACLSILMGEVRGSKKEDERGPLGI